MTEHNGARLIPAKFRQRKRRRDECYARLSMVTVYVLVERVGSRNQTLVLSSRSVMTGTLSLRGAYGIALSFRY